MYMIHTYYIHALPTWEIRDQHSSSESNFFCATQSPVAIALLGPRGECLNVRPIKRMFATIETIVGVAEATQRRFNHDRSTTNWFQLPSKRNPNPVRSSKPSDGSQWSLAVKQHHHEAMESGWLYLPRRLSWGGCPLRVLF